MQQAAGIFRTTPTDGFAVWLSMEPWKTYVNYLWKQKNHFHVSLL